jgi:hypothetical protein
VRKRWSSCVPALTLAALASNAHAATPSTGDAPQPAPEHAEASSPAAQEAEDSKWWSFDQDAFLQGLGVESTNGTFGIGMWRTILDLRANGNMQQTTSPGFPDAEFYSYLTEQGITFRNLGWYLLDPRLLVGDASVRFGFQQARQDSGETRTGQGGDITDYYLNLTLLSEKPYTAMLRAARSEYVTSHSGGGTTASTVEMRGATLYWREASILREKEIAPYFSATLFGGQEDLREVTTNAGQRFERDEQRDRVRLDAHNAFLNSDLTLALEQVNLDNRIFPQASDRSRNADVTYSLDFGENLNWHADSHVHYNERTGDFDTDSLDGDVRFLFEHTAFFSSTASYLYQDSGSPLGKSTSQFASVGAQYLPFLNVTTNLDLSGSLTDLDGGTITTEGVSGGVIYDHSLPAAGTLTVSVNGALVDSDSQLDEAGVPVVDEAYQAPPELGAGAGFLLNQRDVITSTIVIVNVRDGARLPTTEGIDYVVEVLGDRTRIEPLATSAVIRGGDPLEITYVFLTDPSLKSRTTSQSYIVTTDWSWIAVTLSHDVTEQEPLDGTRSTLLSDQDRTMLQLLMRGDWNAWVGRATARVSRYRDDRLNYDEVRLNQNLTWRPSYDWQVGLDAGQSASSFVDTGRESRRYDARLSASWHSEHGWWADGYLSWRTLSDTEVEDETITEGYLRVRRNWPQLSLSCAVGMGQRDRGGVQTTYENLQINITRVF